MKRFLIPVLFLFLSALNGGEDNFPQIRAHKTGWYGGQIDIYRFTDSGANCYVASSNNGSRGGYVGISCVPIQWTGATFTAPVNFPPATGGTHAVFPDQPKKAGK